LRAVRGGAKHFVELDETPVQLDELGASLANELVVEAVLPKHLEDQPAEIALALVTDLKQRASLAA
jgi:hypothetical protein